ncbi:MAG: F0F1 ATP synthase subunit epsilon [Pseudomonadota bacterium]
MADTVQFDLVSPERILSSVQASEVQIPGADGDMTAMADHAPVITTLRPGFVRVSGPDGSSDYVVTGGFAEIGAEGISLLAEQAVPRDEFNQDVFSALIADAKTRLEKAKAAADTDGAAVDEAEKLLADMAAVGDEIGLSST